MGKYGGQKNGGYPPMHVSEQPSHGYLIAYMCNAFQRVGWFWGVEEKHKPTRDQLKDDEKQRKTAKAVEEIDVRRYRLALF